MGKVPELNSTVLSIEPSVPAVQFEGGWSTCADLSDMMGAIERAVAAAGLGPETRIAILLRNRPEIIAAILAVHQARGCLVALNASLPDDRLAEEITKAAAPVLVGSAHDFSRPALVEAARGLGAAALSVDLTQPVGQRVQEVAHWNGDVQALREIPTNGSDRCKATVCIGVEAGPRRDQSKVLNWRSK